MEATFHCANNARRATSRMVRTSVKNAVFQRTKKALNIHASNSSPIRARVKSASLDISQKMANVTNAKFQIATNAALAKIDALHVHRDTK